MYAVRMRICFVVEGGGFLFLGSIISILFIKILHCLFLKHFKPFLFISSIPKDEMFLDSDPNLIFEDMQVMSDFELHRLCVRYKVISLFFHFLIYIFFFFS